MKRKITAWFLLMLMVVFTTMAHSGLRYCLCKKEVFLGKCQCEQVGFSTPINHQPESKEQEACCCCVAHSDSDSDLQLSSNKRQPEVLSCGTSCVVDLTLQLDDFILIESDLATKSADDIQLVSLGFWQEAELTEETLSPDIHSPRGSPPPFHRLSVPIYLRDCVYRI